MGKVFGVAVLSFVVALSQPSFAALGVSASDTRNEIALAGLGSAAPVVNVLSEAQADICVPPEEQYIPSFVRDPGGRIIGVNYTVIEYVC